MTTSQSIVSQLAAMAGKAETVVETVARIEPTIASVAGMFVPGAAPVEAMVQPWMLMAFSFLERALGDIAKSNGGDIMSAFLELLQHISPGQPNSPALASSANPSPLGSNTGETKTQWLASHNPAG